MVRAAVSEADVNEKNGELVEKGRKNRENNVEPIAGVAKAINQYVLRCRNAGEAQCLGCIVILIPSRSEAREG